MASNQKSNPDKGRSGAPRTNLSEGGMTRQTAPAELDSKSNREKWELEDPNNFDRGPYLVELNVQHIGGLPGAASAFMVLFAEVVPPVASQDGIPAPPDPVRIGKSYYRCELRVSEWTALVAADERRAATMSPHDPEERSSKRTIYRLWPDFPVTSHLTRSVSTIKADAALRSFEANGEEIVWAVIDSGVEFRHAHFGPRSGAAIKEGSEAVIEEHMLLNRKVRDLHRCFATVKANKGGVWVSQPPLADPDVKPLVVPQPTSLGAAASTLDPSIGSPAPPGAESSADTARKAEEYRESLVKAHRKAALKDDYGHGTHVAGIITGRAPKVEVERAAKDGGSTQCVVLEREDRIEDVRDNNPVRTKRTVTHPLSKRETERMHGVAPGCLIVSLRVLDHEGKGRSSDVIRALEYIRETINDNPKMLRVHGVNLSVGYEFDAEMFACGQSPLCTEVNRLVQAGVVVVTAAGNTGYGSISALDRAAKAGLSNTINDPGNADLAITVGATHRESPHTYGVSYFSSKGPTGDGRLKPDLVAPGERIVSCAAGSKCQRALDDLAGEQPLAVSLKEKAPGSDSEEEEPKFFTEYACYVEDSGTSMAAPHVSGAIAAFLSIRKEFIGRPLEVKKIFLSSAIPLGRERYFEGNGMLDLMKAIQSV
jgi:subtilisin family serine protease